MRLLKKYLMMQISITAMLRYIVSSMIVSFMILTNTIADAAIVPLQDQAAALMEVAAGTSDACVIDITMANAMTGEGTSYADLTYSLSLTSEEYGVSFRKDSDLTAKFNDFMAKLMADGTLDALAAKYNLTLAK